MSTTKPQPAWVNRAAALHLVALADGYTHAERRDMLDALGLLTPDGGIKPDPTDDQVKALVSPSPTINGDLNEHLPAGHRMTNIDRPPQLRGQFCPPGLREFIQNPPEPTQTPRQPAVRPQERPKTSDGTGRPKKPRAPRVRAPKPPARALKPPAPPKPPKQLQPCGTEPAYRRHIKRGERGNQIDAACRKARNEANARRVQERRQAAIAAGEITPRKVAQCGTPAGYRRHTNLRNRGNPDEIICEPCKEAKRVANRRYGQAYRDARPSAPKTTMADLEPCGTPEGRARHRRHHERLCDACRTVQATTTTEQAA